MLLIKMFEGPADLWKRCKLLKSRFTLREGAGGGLERERMRKAHRRLLTHLQYLGRK